MKLLHFHETSTKQRDLSSWSPNYFTFMAGLWYTLHWSLGVIEILSVYGSEEILMPLSEVRFQLFSPYFITINCSYLCHQDDFSMGQPV